MRSIAQYEAPGSARVRIYFYIRSPRSPGVSPSKNLLLQEVTRRKLGIHSCCSAPAYGDHQSREMPYASRTGSAETRVKPSTTGCACRAGASLHVLPHLLQRPLEVRRDDEAPLVVPRPGY